MNDTDQDGQPIFPRRTGVHEPNGTAIIGERWQLSREQADTALGALSLAAGVGKGKAADLYRELVGEDPDAPATPRPPISELDSDDIPPWDDSRYWAYIDLEPFAVDADTEEVPEGVFRLDRLRDKSTFEDRQERRYEKVCDGPVQGSVVISNGEYFAQWDVGTLVHPLDESAIV